MIIHCPFCQAQFEVEESMFGQSLECGACNQTFSCGKNASLQGDVDKLEAEKQELVEEVETLKARFFKLENSSKAVVNLQSLENREDFFSIKGSHFSFYKDGSMVIDMTDESRAEQVGDAFVAFLKNGYPEELEAYQNFRKYHEQFAGLLGL